MDLCRRLIVHRVVNLAGAPALQRGDDGAHQVIAVDHVDEAFAFARDLRFVPQVLQKQVAAARPVNAGYAQNHGRELAFGHRCQKKLFCLYQSLARFAGRRSRTGFLDQ